jgi:hypothetical protein
VPLHHCHEVPLRSTHNTNELVVGHITLLLVSLLPSSHATARIQGLFAHKRTPSTVDDSSAGVYDSAAVTGPEKSPVAHQFIPSILSLVVLGMFIRNESNNNHRYISY